MSELVVLFGALLINNFALAPYLGLCPSMGIIKGLNKEKGKDEEDPALITGLATAAVVSVAAPLSFLAHSSLLTPLGLEYLNLILLIVLVGGLVKLVTMSARRRAPELQLILSDYLPLIATNSAILAAGLLVLGQPATFLQALGDSVGGALCFALVLTVFGALHERLTHDGVPEPMRGAPLTLISAGLMGLAFMGFQGFGA
ncbi:MAG: Rnf-Nqr domain containing protein [Pseudomonadota bacterium]